MILFCGKQEQGFFLEEMQLEDEIQYTGYEPDINVLFDKMTQQLYTAVIVPVEALISPASEIAEVLARVQLASNNMVLVLAKGLNPECEVLAALAAAGVTRFITAWNLAEQKEQCKILLEGGELQVQPPAAPAAPQNREPSQAPPMQRPYRTVALCGAQQRIGTTTQAVQMVKFLQAMGCSACYIELNKSGYIEALQKLYCKKAKHDPTRGKVTYMETDLYYRQDRLKDVLQQGYDYYIYDYGSITQTEFNITAFSEKDTLILVGGVKPSELPYTTMAIKQLCHLPLHYLFSFTGLEEQECTLELMAGKNGMPGAETRTYFSPYIEDAFLYASTRKEIYAPILQAPEQNQDAKSKKHRSRPLFGRRRPA